MKKFLPIILTVLFFFATIISPISVAHAQPLSITTGTATTSGWVEDPEVTFIGKNAARSGYVLNWTLINYQWACVTKIAQRNCDNAGNPLASFWQKIVFWIVLPLLLLVILATSMVIIITRGKSLTIMRFVPRFIAILILIAMSYAIIQFLYQFTDLIQGFFLRPDPNGSVSCPPSCIQDADLLYVGWQYQDFVGLRLLGPNNTESAFISLLLVKLTALTYFVMVGILLIRKIILWFFIIVSPVFPLLLLFYPVRNTGKIWIGEFFRWLLYGPLFAIFLQGLVFMWKGGNGNGQGIPLQFQNAFIQDPSHIIYPTAINILLGGPRQYVTSTNSINLTETFMLYVVALIMLWIVILLPWILLQIFLDYASNFSSDNTTLKNLVTLVSNKMVTPPSPVGYPPPATRPGSTALTLPFTKKTVNIPFITKPVFKGTGGLAKEIPFESEVTSRQAIQTQFLATAKVNAEVMSFANIPLPTMRDIARFDSALTSSRSRERQEIIQMRSVLEKIGNPAVITSTVERERYTSMRERLVTESQKGNVVATTILNAINSAGAVEVRKSIKISESNLKNILQNIANPAALPAGRQETANIVDRERMTQLHDWLSRESKEKNNQLAASILSVSDRTTAAEFTRIKDQLIKEQTLGNSVANTVLSVAKSSQIKTILQNIASPATVTNTVEREKMTKLHDMLTHESKEKNNQLATSILQVKDTTSVVELEKINENLEKTKESTMSSQILATIANSLEKEQGITQVKSLLQQVANPAKATDKDREKVTKLHEQLKRESLNGNALATSLLSVNESTTTTQIEKLKENLKEAKEKGQSVAADILSQTTQRADINIPTSNRIQTVTQGEIEEVKKMWKENYSNIEVPEGMAGTRSEWIKDDIEKITSLTSLLTSSDQEKVNQGLSEVANILPFLLVGGFSQSEIVSYLQAKQEAAKEVLEQITREEETKVTVETKRTETVAQTMHTSLDASPVGIATPSVTTFVQPQVTSEILAMVNLKVPTMRDIARFESQTLSRDKSQMLEVQKVRETLEKIANPASISAATERAKFNDLREKLIAESQKGNLVANMVLTAANMSQAKAGIAAIQAQDIKQVLTQIASPAQVASETEREVFTKLHEALVTQSKEKKNQELVSAILSVNDSTSHNDVQIIKEKLEKARVEGDIVASSVLSTINKSVHVNKVKQVLQQIANPAPTTSTVDRERFTKLHESLVKAGREGNETAISLLSVTKGTSNADIEKLSDKLKQESIKGVAVSAQVLEAMPQAVSLPTANRIQTVTPEEIEEVKKMWKENYANIEVPEGMAGTRSEWVKDDIEKISSLTNLLTSNDQEKVNQGLSEVANILPFLLVGGFSQSEIVSYLQAKQEAAKEVLEQITREEETKVTVETKRTETVTPAMHANLDSAAVGIATPQFQSSTPAVNQVSSEILSLVNLKIPSLKDIVRFEVMAIAKDRSKADEMQKAREVLENIASPSKIQNTLQRQQVETLREKLIEESSKGNTTAETILSAAVHTAPASALAPISVAKLKTLLQQFAAAPLAGAEAPQSEFNEIHDSLTRESKEKYNELATMILAVNDKTGTNEIERIRTDILKEHEKATPLAQALVTTINNITEINQTRKVLQQIAKPSGIASAVNREKFTKLNKDLLEASKNGNILAQAILDIKPETKLKDIEKLKQDLAVSKLKDPLAKSILASLTSLTVPADNNLQPPVAQDYTEIETMWEENYRTLPVPFGFADNMEGRILWIEKDIEDIQATLDYLESTDMDKKNEGLQKVRTILPFLLLGGFSFQEIINYLGVKLKAAKTVLSELKSEEGKQEKIQVDVSKNEEPKTQAVEEDNNKIG